ncbi:MAG: hypothetical protein ABI824_12465 [Acidobacteriota bacterium]
MKLLITHEVRFLLIGGYAVNAFGHVRNTVDMDIWIDGRVENRSRVVIVVREFGFANATDDILNEPDAMLRMGVPPLRIEVMRKLTGVRFEECWPRRLLIEVDGLSIPMISLADLRLNKQAAGRPKDLLDLDELS